MADQDELGTGHSRSTARSFPSTGWPPAASEVVDLGGRVHYFDFGGPPSAPTVTCVHGLGGSALNFGVIGPLLARHHRVVAIDLWGHGRSDAGPPPAKGQYLEAQRTLLDRFLREVVGEPGVVIGHSLGGVVTMLQAVRSAATIEDLVLLNPPVPHRTRWARDPRMTAKLGLLRAPGVRSIVDRQLRRTTPEQLVEKQLADATPHRDRVPVDLVRAAVEEVRLRATLDDAAAARRAQWEAIIEVVALLARAREWSEHVQRIDQPTLWLAGEDDPLVPLPEVRALTDVRPDWTVATRAGVGHLPHVEDAEWTAAQVLDSPR